MKPGLFTNMAELIQQLIQLIHLFSLPISIIALFISIRQYCLSKRVNILRPHSDRLVEVFEAWLESRSFLPDVLSPEDIPEDINDVHLPPLKSDLSGLRFAEDHLKTGYREKYREINDLRKQISKHNDEIKKFVEASCEKLKEELELLKYKAGYGAYYRRIVVMSLKKITIGYPETELKISPGAKPSEKWKLEWSNYGLIIGNKEECERGLSIIKELYTSPNVVEKANELLRNAKSLEDKRTELEEWLRINLVDKIKIGGIIKGKCEACK